MLQRDGQVVLKMLNDVKTKTITPVIKTQIKQYSKIYTDEYAIYNWLSDFYYHKTVNHGRKEYARDDDNDGFCEVHVNTCEGFWSLLRSWLRPHRGISQEKLPYYIGFFEVIHNARKRGKAVLHQLLAILL